jgi:hypothetical protein
MIERALNAHLVDPIENPAEAQELFFHRPALTAMPSGIGVLRFAS